MQNINITCPQCQLDKNIEEFGKCASYAIGRKYICKSCEAAANRRSRAANKSWVDQQQELRQTLSGCLRSVFQSAKSRAKNKSLSFTMTKENLIALYENQKGTCAVTGLRMSFETGVRMHHNPFKVSLDRIDSGLGYDVGNIQLVCGAVNRAKTDHSMEEFKFWVDAMYFGLHRTDNQKPSGE